MTTITPPATTNAAPQSAPPRRTAASNERSHNRSAAPVASTSTLPNGKHLSDTAPTNSTPKSPPQHRFKVVLIGDAGVGKTSLRQRWLSEAFTLGYRATIGVDFISKVVEIDQDVHVSLSVWDTAGQDRFRALGASFYRGADACVLVYSDSRSLHSLQSWFDEFTTKAPVDDPHNFTWVAVRSKIDLDATVEEGGSPFSAGEEEELLQNLLGQSSEDLDVEEEETVGYTVKDSAGPAVSSPRKTTTRRKVSNASNMTKKGSFRNGVATCCAEMPTRIDILPPPSTTGGSRSSSPTRETAPQLLRSPRGLSVQKNQIPASTSLKTIYHTPSSSFNESLDSLASGADTITPSRRRGEPSLIRSPLTSSEASEDDFGDMANGLEIYKENSNSADYERDVARGIDPFMASSPPHPPSHLVTIGKHLGGPSLFQKNEKMRLIEEERKRNERKMDNIPGGEVGGPMGSASIGLEGGYSYGKDGIKLFRTSAKTGEGVEDVFEYIAKRATWQWYKDEKEHKHQLERGGPVVRLGPQPKGSKWREACCS
ncbi:BZ3500_MvSof-1268-A1-R1_Chr1-1g01191 [Microbotryum saponariae]|uniref:BZ3500_MvSof-1268-A1-R1_Chr1-1g01191 protein n=1 Tax=Microbotryum saponariae TaxID=289078 RepID=A0A2X0ME16_9BASI|nr:BZ3500_MvSof-1268-A1-R1_Chr1-1g01191 [Microbotryum saponariae]SCZ93621.1 BZ3501_MvSof-1269-A2-R1_Chr1-1g00787 [Microbotryum saponariae]